MTYAIIKVAGKQYRVREGERLLVDRLPQDDGATFTPTVLLVGGNGDPVLDAGSVQVTARVLAAVKGPKIRIGKYKKRTGYRRHTGFRSSLTQIEIESIGGAKKPARAAAKPKAETAEKPVKAEKATPAAPKATPAAPKVAEPAAATTPEGYAEMTIADIKAAAGSWDARALAAALEFERENANRKGAVAALESALAAKEGES